MDYDVVIPTRNRLPFLRISLPTFLSQSSSPRRLIVVDGSDDHAPVREYASELSASYGDVEIIVKQAMPGTASARNRGLDSVKSELVFFTEDDALWYRDSAFEVLQIYRRDREGLIGGVKMTEVDTMPAFAQPSETTSHGSRRAKLLYSLSSVRASIENRFTPNPLHSCGRGMLDQHIVPAWLPQASATPTWVLGGGWASYRTNSIQRVRFDETLTGYALYEDYDASLGVLADQLLVQSQRALAFHHRAPGPRGEPREIGAKLLLNLCYVTCKYSPSGSTPRQGMMTYARTRLAQHWVRAYGSYGRERLYGLRCALRWLPELLEASPADLANTYTRALEQCSRPTLAGRKAGRD